MKTKEEILEPFIYSVHVYDIQAMVVDEEYAIIAMEQYANQWISVDEKLPDISVEGEYPKYILLYNGHHMGVGYYQPQDDADNSFQDWCDESGDWIEPTPTHWRPLPLAPVE